MKEGYYNKLAEKIPVTIITGYLGSGKTTFLNHILRKYSNTKFAIIENEFGELGVDRDLLLDKDIPVYEMHNGCICCSLNKAFYQTLENIIDNRLEIDHLLVETTGVADPVQIVDLFMFNKFIQKNYIIDSVICLTDSAALEKNLKSEPEVLKQIALADIVMLNKTDLLKTSDTKDLRKLIGEINPMAEVIETLYAHTNGSPILNTKAYSCNHIERSTMSFDGFPGTFKGAEKPIVLDGYDHVLGQNSNKHAIQAEGFVFDDCLDIELFNIWMSSFIYFHQSTLYRAKGVLSFKNNNRRIIFQAVKGACVLEEGSPWKEEEKRFSKIVFIGKYINREELENKIGKLFEKQQQ